MIPRGCCTAPRYDTVLTPRCVVLQTFGGWQAGVVLRRLVLAWAGLEKSEEKVARWQQSGLLGEAHRVQQEEGSESQPDAESAGLPGREAVGHGRAETAGVVRGEDQESTGRLNGLGLSLARHYANMFQSRPVFYNADRVLAAACDNFISEL